VAASHFIDEDQALHQIEQLQKKLDEEGARGRANEDARRLLTKARELLDAGQFSQAFMLAVRARGIAVERLP